MLLFTPDGGFPVENLGKDGSSEDTVQTTIDPHLEAQERR